MNIYIYIFIIFLHSEYPKYNSDWFDPSLTAKVKVIASVNKY
jgi:hypothetical protein